MIGATARGGSYRTALSDADRDARNLFVLWAKEANLSVTIERIGNIFAQREGSDSSLPPIMVGSHLDTSIFPHARLRALAGRPRGPSGGTAGTGPRFPPEQTVRFIKLYHRQVYGYAYHRLKLEFIRAGTLDDKRWGETRFGLLANFLESVPTTCPHELFRRADDPKARASQARPSFADPSRIIVNSKRNTATETAAFIIPAVGNNKLRHETLQRFMLINDSVTVAIEVPI